MKVSVITVNLNDKAGLKRTFESVHLQIFTDFEHIIIDGGSTDGSVDEIKRHQDKIAYWVTEPDKGIYNAMNKGISKAKGEYCFFLNAGDLFASETVLSKIFEDEPHESFICGNYITEKQEQVEKLSPYRTRTWEMALYDIFSEYLCHQAFFIKTEIFEKYGYYDEQLRIMSDWKLFLIAIGIQHEKVVYKDVFISIFNIEGLSNTIGGTAIYKEKKAVIQSILPKPVADKLERLYYLQRNDFWVDFVHANKCIYFIARCFLKICNLLRITKL